MLRQLIVPLLVLTVAFSAAAPAMATVLVPADMTELAREASVIVYGRVVDVRPQWADNRRRIETIVTLAVGEALKGQPGRHVSVRVPGGEMGRYRSVMVGAPTFRVGEDVVLFLGGAAPAMPHLLGLGQGVYRVSLDAGTGRTLVTPSVIPTASSPTRITRGDPNRRPVTVAEFARQVRAAIGSGEDFRERDRRGPGGGRGTR